MTATTTSTRPWERDGSIHLDSFDDIAVERAMEGWREGDEDVVPVPSTTTRDPIEADEDGFVANSARDGRVARARSNRWCGR